MKKKHATTTLKKVGLILVVGGVVATAGLLYAGHQTLKQANTAPATPAVVTPPAFTLDPTIKTMGDNLGIPTIDLTTAKAHYGDSTSVCKQVAAGCYNGEITVDRNPSTGLHLTPQTILGHEYMHYVWAHKVDQATKDQVNALTQAFFTKYQANVAPRFTAYDAVATTDMPNERQAIFCTEIRDSRLQPALLNYCRTYLPNRNALPSYF